MTLGFDAGAGLTGVITWPSVFDLGFVAAESVEFRSGDFADSAGRSLAADDGDATRTPSAASGVRGRGKVPLRIIGRELLSVAAVGVSVVTATSGVVAGAAELVSVLAEGGAVELSAVVELGWTGGGATPVTTGCWCVV